MGEIIKRKIKRLNWKAKTAIILCFTLIFSTFMYEGWYKPKQSKAITYSSAGAITYGTASPLSVAYPSGIVSGDLLVLIVGMKPNTAGSGNSSVTTPAGWTALGSIYGATGTIGVDTGPTNLFTFYRVANGTETGTLSVSMTGQNVAWAQIYRFTGNTSWSVAQATGTDTTGNATVSIAFGTNPGVQQGDYILAAMCVPTDVGAGNQFSAQAFTQSGVTFGTVTEISEPYSASGSDIGGFVVWTSVSTGTATGNPTMTATASGTTGNIYGPGVFIRIRETNPPVPGPVTVSPDTGTYTSGSPTITTTFTEYSSNITGCQYTTNGSTWVAGTLSGTRPNYTCTANPAGLSGAVTINMRATSGDGTGTATAITRTVDNTGPTDGTLTATSGGGTGVGITLSWTAASDAQSGLRATNTYDLRVLAGSTPPTCSTGTSIYVGTDTSYVHTGLTNMQQYSYRVCAYDALNNVSTGATATAVAKVASAITSCGMCHGYTSSFNDGTARNNPEGTFVGDHNAHVVKAGAVCSVCHVTPATETSADYNHRNGNIQMKAGATAISGGYYDKNNNAAYNAGTDDTWQQTNTPTTASCRNISCHGGNNPTPQWGVGTASCVSCHNGTVTATKASALSGGTVTQRDNVVAEFGLAWGHKKSGRGAVTDSDCIVCHLEGDYTTQRTSSYHADGYIDLRDPDGAGETRITDISGNSFRFVRFSTSYAAGSRTTTGHLSNNTDNVLTQKFCIACHDANGASNPTARTTYGTPTYAMPFGGVNLGANYTTTNDAIAAGGTINVAKQFATTNSSVHPVLGPRNKDYPLATRLAVPYNNIGAGRTDGGHVKADSVVLNCFDCHNSSTPLTNRTIVAHGNANTLRGTIYVASPTLCTTCHVGYNASPGTNSSHGAGSAGQWGGNNGENATTNCWACHSSTGTTTRPARPIPAQDYHGNNALVGGGLWPTINSRPYAFIRGWSGTAYHRPYRSSEFTSGSATCGAGTCPSNGQVGDGSTRTYSPGGSY